MRFELERFAADCGFEAVIAHHQHAQVQSFWAGNRIIDDLVNGWYDVTWSGHQLRILSLTLDDCARVNWILGPSDTICREFFAAIMEWQTAVHGEILVFESGHFSKDAKLVEAIRSATFDNLVLSEGIAQDVASDVARFFESRDVYARYGIPWKRGVLFSGPPGNGKTHAVKAIINSLQRPCLYVKSFDLPGQYAPQYGISMVFDRVRDLAPALLVIEDIDSVIGDHNRSFFLNEVDGFAGNDGIVILATTNHPERLDPAIIERPSRFDRKYAFAVPDRGLRARYIHLWNTRLNAELALGEDDMAVTADATEGFSFAYLQELFISSMIRWVSDRRRPLAHVMRDEVETLRLQMAANAAVTPALPLNAAGAGMRHMMAAFAAGNDAGFHSRMSSLPEEE